jgi:hypothetical protein
MLAAAGAAAAPSAPAAADVLRCSGGLIDVGMVAPQVVAKCGQPRDKDVEDVPIRVRSTTGALATVGTTRVERWTYDRGYGQFPALLIFEDGKLKRIELLTDQ